MTRTARGQWFSIDAPEGWGVEQSTDGVLLVAPDAGGFVPNVVLRELRTSATVASTSRRTVAELVRDVEGAVVLSVDPVVRDGLAGRRIVVLVPARGTERVMTVIHVRDIVLVDGVMAEVTGSAPLAANRPVWTQVMDVAASLRPLATDQRGTVAQDDLAPIMEVLDEPATAEAGQPRELLSDVGVPGPVRKVDLGMELSGDAVAAFKGLLGGGRLFRPKVDVRSAGGQELLDQRLVDTKGVISELGQYIVGLTRRGRPLTVQDLSRPGSAPLSAWVVDDEFVAFVPPSADHSDHSWGILLGGLDELLRLLLQWSGQRPGWSGGAEMVLTASAVEQKVLDGVAPAAAPGAAARLANQPWRYLSATGAEADQGVGWIVTPEMGTFLVGVDEQDTVRVDQGTDGACWDELLGRLHQLVA